MYCTHPPKIKNKNQKRKGEQGVRVFYDILYQIVVRIYYDVC